MQVLRRLHSRMVLVGRVIMWAAIGLLFGIGVYSNSPAWAQSTRCNENSSIPTLPLVLFLRFGGPAETYEVLLCKNPVAAVNVSTTVSPGNRVTVDPTDFVLNDTTPTEVSVGIVDTHPEGQPFTALITHTASSDDSDFDGAVVTQVTAYYSPPVALNDRQMIRVGEDFTFDVQANDIDRLGQGLETSLVTLPARGTASVNDDGEIEYSAPTGRPGADPFIYQITDPVGNVDTARVLPVIVPANVQNPQMVDVAPDEGASVVFPTGDGDVEIEIPALNGVGPESEVVCTYATAVTTNGTINSRPVKPSRFTGLVFYIDCFVDGEPVTDEQLTTPISVFIPLSEEFLAVYGGTKLSVANWDGAAWRTDGVEIISEPGATILGISTTLLGESPVFSQSSIYMPVMLKQVEDEE